MEYEKGKTIWNNSTKDWESIEDVGKLMDQGWINFCAHNYGKTVWQVNHRDASWFCNTWYNITHYRLLRRTKKIFKYKRSGF